jgi:protease IV
VGLILVAAVGVSLLGAFLVGQAVVGSSSFLASGGTGVRPLFETVLEDHGAREKVAVIDLQGVITGRSLGLRGSPVDSIRDQLDRAGLDPAVKAVVLRVDSPGGEVLASDEIYEAVRAFQMSNDIPVIASMGSLAASGGYYVSAPCRWIVAHPLTLTGSIGVIFHGYNYRGLMDKVGVLPEVVKSGKLKDMMSGDRRPDDISAEEREIMQQLVRESFDRFKEVIREGRRWSAKQNQAEGVKEGRELAANWEEIADGRILSGKQALEAGLVDELGDFQRAVRRAKSLAGISQANLITYQSPPTVGDLLGLWGKAGNTQVRLELPGLLPESELAPGRLHFISPLHIR